MATPKATNIRLGPTEKSTILSFLKSLSTSNPDDILIQHRESLCTKVRAHLVSVSKSKGSNTSTVDRYASLIKLDMIAKMIEEASYIPVDNVPVDAPLGVPLV